MSQTYFFMSNSDTQEFLKYLASIGASANDEQVYPSEFEGRNTVYLSLNYLPCRRHSETILFGRIATPKKYDQTESEMKTLRNLYGKISRWIKKNYTDDLIYKNHFGEISENSISYWLGPNLKQLLGDSCIYLKGSTNSNNQWILGSDLTG